ncbi:MAG: CHC2 zinc finger domain-containing protein [Candidatus Pacebacteria bacterium]|nr:CHC2 zinc finger domain-containing protein [Candidatus Paceibacterota bacterium]
MPKGKGEFVDFKQVKQSVTILQILDHYGITASLKRTGDTLNGPCPLHGGHNPTQFRVSVAKNCYNCFGECQAGGNILDFVAKKENVNIRNAALLIQKWFSVDSSKGKKPAENTPKAPATSEPQKPACPPVEKPEPTSPPAETPKQQEESDAPNKPLGFALKNLNTAHPYLQERGLTKETVETFGLGFCEKGTMTGRIVIPIHNIGGELVGYAGRFPGTPSDDTPKYKLPKGFRKNVEVFNLHRAAKAEPGAPLVVVEGYFGCFTVWQAGIHRVVAITGWFLSDVQAALIAQVVGKNGRVIFMLDAGKVGQAGQEQALVKLASKVFVQTVALKPERPQPDQLSPTEILELLQ